MHSSRGPILIAALIVLLGTGLSVPGKAAEPPQKGKPGRPALSDEQLAEAIRARYAKSKIGANHFTVTVQSGVATVEGVAQVPQHKGVATRLAKLAGAKAVRNQIRISGAKAPAAKKTRPAKTAPGEKKARESGKADAGASADSEEAEKPRKVTVRWVKTRP